MTLTLERCYKHIEHTLAGPIDSLDNVDIINAAGTWYTAQHQWKFLERASTTLGYVANQNYATLPPDFAEIIKIAFTSGLTARFFLTTTGTLADYRTAQMNFGIAVTYGAITFQAAAATGGAPTPVLELYPTPQTTNPTALTIFYRAGWTTPDPSQDEAALNIPTYCEPSFIQTLRAFARGYQNEDGGSIDRRLTEIMAGPTWDAAITQDGIVQPDFGKMRGGAVSIGIPPPTTFASPYSISSP